MNCVQLIFSPTGGTMRAAKAITDPWGLGVETIDLTDPALADRAFQKEDLVLIAVPSFGGRVPELAAQRLTKMRGNSARCVLCCVYGNRAYEDTLVEMQDIAEKQGFRVFAAVAAIAEHSIMHQYAAGRPDTKDTETLRNFSRTIWEKFNSSQEESSPAIPGNRPYKKAGGAGLVPKAGKECIRCGVCAAQCPAQAISRDAPQKTDGKKCVSCMRCVVQCPHGARKVNGAMVSVAAAAIKKACSVRKECELYI